MKLHFLGFFFILSNTASAANLSLLSTERFMAIKGVIQSFSPYSVSHNHENPLTKFPIRHRTCLRDVHINLGILVVWTASTIVATSKWYIEVKRGYFNGAYHL